MSLKNTGGPALRLIAVAATVAVTTAFFSSQAQACWANIKIINETGSGLDVRHVGTQKTDKKAWLRVAGGASCILKSNETCLQPKLTTRKHGTEFKTRIVYRLYKSVNNKVKQTKLRIAESGLGKCRSGSETTFHEGNITHTIKITRAW